MATRKFSETLQKMAFNAPVDANGQPLAVGDRVDASRNYVVPRDIAAGKDAVVTEIIGELIKVRISDGRVHNASPRECVKK